MRGLVAAIRKDYCIGWLKKCETAKVLTYKVRKWLSHVIH